MSVYPHPTKPGHQMIKISHGRKGKPEYISYPGSREDALIYERSLQWYAQRFGSSKDAIQYQNKVEGKIIAKGSDAFTIQTGIYQAPHPVVYTLIQEIKDGKTRVTISDVGLADLYGRRYENIYAAAWDQVQPRIMNALGNLDKHINATSPDW